MLQIADRQTGESAVLPAALVYDLADKVRMRAVVATAAVAAAIGLAEAQFAPTSSPDARCYHVRIRCHSTLAHCALGSGPERQPAPRSASPLPLNFELQDCFDPREGSKGRLIGSAYSSSPLHRPASSNATAGIQIPDPNQGRPEP